LWMDVFKVCAGATHTPSMIVCVEIGSATCGAARVAGRPVQWLQAHQGRGEVAKCAKDWYKTSAGGRQAGWANEGMQEV
jgi:hypothetical protein